MRLQVRSISIQLLGLFFLLISCGEEKEDFNEAQEYISQTQKEFAPDKRVALFEITSEESDATEVLKGETNLPRAKKALLAKLDSAGVKYIDSIQVLPAKDLQGKEFGVIDVSVANLRGEGKHSAELVTQATLGTPVKIWKRTDQWYYIQTPDDYLAWVDHGGITTMSSEEFKNWKASEKVIYTKTFGQSYTGISKDSVVSDLVIGDILELEAERENFFKVRYPDGRAAFIPKDDSQIYSEWLKNTEASPENLVATSEKLMGLPYLWGGTSAKGVDCSGFTKTIYFMNGLVVPRDASQQVHEGKLIDSTGDFSKLEVGDLLFFGRPATDSTSEKVVHVGMWIGNDQFIHSSGDVHISSMDENAPDFDKYNRDRYLRAKRYLGSDSRGLKYLKNRSIFEAEPADSLNF
ncbi:glycoside hydrolase [Christiangramia fulva]|uniref:Glycoside hydrolase n=1 Tax=Christiangramia fulva TaxID=2126553 RepID=A0A2R3Z3H7_9FLAO|nr:C40 family peptidase [Christiangramia fulva]AVR44815.1 glycoside hydrolase [Christiangramia fulva]